MLEISHFILIISLGLGLVAIYIAMQLKLEYNKKIITPYVFFLVGINIVTFIHIIEAFMRIIFKDVNYMPEPQITKLLFFSILDVTRVLIAYYLIVFSLNLINKKVNKNLKKTSLFFILIFLILNILFNYFFSSFRPMWVGLQWSTSSMIFLSFIFSFTVLLIYLQKMKQREKYRHFMFFIFSLFFYGFNIYLFRVLEYFDWISYKNASVILSLVILFFNLLNVFYFKKFITIFLDKKTININGNSKKLFILYKITNREQEIINLIKLGKTNKEIGEELYIASVTVRDYCSKIYKKTGTNNRTQVAGLFSD